ncbi:tripartite motif-containing protein 2-like isoform X2 [Clytia hemisphaerica]|uniref:tripartite motif-containing protein 2-like isoform X2 n=1 Tax=Clytia hemisphaerica TaxID=252671 RepID=UPI0034D5D553
MSLVTKLHKLKELCSELGYNIRVKIIDTNEKEVNGISDFPPNFVINNQIDVESVRNSASKPMLCSSCNEQLPATARCLDCMEFLCYACHNAHSRVRMTKDHHILTLEQLKRSEDVSGMLHRPVFCQTHKEERVSYFCNTCQQTICRECVITTHQQNSHEYTNIEHAIEGQRNEITSLKQVIEMKLPILNRATSQLSETQQKLDSRSQLITSEIEDRTPRLLKLLEQKEEEMLRELNEIVEGKKKILQKQLEQLEVETKNLKSLYEFTGQILKTGTSAEILMVKQALCERMKTAVTSEQTYEPEVDDQISCDTNVDSIASAIKSYGQFSTQGEVFLKCFVLGSVTTAVKGMSTQLTLLIKNQLGQEASVSKEDIEVEMKTPDLGIIMPEVREKTSSTFTLNFRTYSLGIHQLHIKLKGKHITGSPFSINVINSSEKQRRGSSDSTSSNDKSPSHLSTNYSKPLSLEINDHPSYKRSDSNEGSKNLYSNDRHSPNPPNNYYLDKNMNPTNGIDDPNSSYRNLLLNTAELSAKYVFSIGQRGTNFAEFHGVFGVASDHTNKRIIATDCHNNRIQVFNEEGKFLFAFGQKGNNDGEFQHPTGVGVGPNGEIVVCERLKGRIQVFNSEGHFQRRFILNQLKASTLTVDIGGRIIIADYTSCCIYILDPILERWSKFGHFGQSEGELQYPGYVATDLKGNIFVSDMNSNKVQMYDSDSIFIRSFGHKGDGNGEFHHPTGIAIDIKGRLVVADRDNHRIQVIQTSGEYITKFGSKSEQGGDLSDLHGVTVLSNGNIAAADLKNNKIVVFTLPQTTDPVMI